VRLLKIDAGTGGRVVEAPCAGTVTFEGYGVAVVTNAPLTPTPQGRGVGVRGMSWT
jgi:hypothetical protein